MNCYTVNLDVLVVWGAASIHDPKIGMFGHSGLMGDQVPIAVGAALGSGKTVLTVVGDASGEEDYVYGAMDHL